MKPKHIMQQAGGMLIETIAGVVILGAVAVGAAELMNRNLDDARAANAAQQLKMVSDAVSTYVQNNASAIAGFATNTTPVLITVQELINAQLLPAGFSGTNTYGQNMCAVVIEPNDADGNPTGRLQTLVVTANGEDLDDVTQATVVNTAGANAGRIENPNSILGARNAWTLNPTATNYFGQTPVRIVNLTDNPCSNPVTSGDGHLAMALWLGNANGGLNQDVLYRVEVPGMTKLNDMETTLRITGTETRGDAESLDQHGIGMLVDNRTNSNGNPKGGNVVLRDDTNGVSGGNIRAAQNITASNGNITADNGNVEATVGNLTIGGNATITGNLQAHTILPTMNTVHQDDSCGSYSNGTLATNFQGKLFSCILSKWAQVGDGLKKYKTIRSGGYTLEPSVSCNGQIPGSKLVSGSCISIAQNGGRTITSPGGRATNINGEPDSWLCPQAFVSIGNPNDANAYDQITTGNVLSEAFAVCELPN